MGDSSADSYLTRIFQCIIPMGNLSEIRSVWYESPSGYGPLGFILHLVQVLLNYALLYNK